MFSFRCHGNKQRNLKSTDGFSTASIPCYDRERENKKMRENTLFEVYNIGYKEGRRKIDISVTPERGEYIHALSKPERVVGYGVHSIIAEFRC